MPGASFSAARVQSVACEHAAARWAVCVDAVVDAVDLLLREQWKTLQHGLRGVVVDPRPQLKAALEDQLPVLKAAWSL